MRKFTSRMYAHLLILSHWHTKIGEKPYSGEIGQVLIARDDLGEWKNLNGKNKETRLLSNVVLMGMGEPLYNFENVRDALKIVMDPEGICLSRKRITLSTSGVVREYRGQPTKLDAF